MHWTPRLFFEVIAVVGTVASLGFYLLSGLSIASFLNFKRETLKTISVGVILTPSKARSLTFTDTFPRWSVMISPSSTVQFCDGKNCFECLISLGVVLMMTLFFFI